MDEKLALRIAASKDYDMLQGLCAVAIGLACIILAATDSTLWFAITCSISAGTAESFYQKRYGKARPHRSRTAATVALALFAALLAVIVINLDFYRPTVVAWGPGLCAIILGGCYWLGERNIKLTRWHWLTLGVLAASTLYPLLGISPNRNLDLTLVGAALAIIGTVDHLRLTSIFGKGSGDE